MQAPADPAGTTVGALFANGDVLVVREGAAAASSVLPPAPPASEARPGDAPGAIQQQAAQPSGQGDFAAAAAAHDMVGSPVLPWCGPSLWLWRGHL